MSDGRRMTGAIHRRVAPAFGAIVAVLIVAGALLGDLAPATAAPAAAASTGAASEPAARRMLVVSLPMVTWAELPLDRLPHLQGLLEQSLVAKLSVRGVHGRMTLGDAYVTISAGTRAAGGKREGDATARPDGAITVPAYPEIVEHNNNLFYDAHPGVLADALRKGGVDRAVIGNADRVLPAGRARRYRPVAGALVDPDGVTPRGDVGTDLFETDPDAPFGARIDQDAYLAAFQRVWTGRTVVVVEASDLVRLNDSRTTTKRTRADATNAVLRSFDQLLGKMLTAVDFERDAVMVVGPTYPRGPWQLPVASLRAPGTKPGLAVTAYTRRSGVASIVDIAPTILDAFHIEAPDSMEGRPFEFGRTGGAFTDRVSYLVDTNHAAVFRDAHVQAVTTAFLVSQLVLVLGAVIAFTWGNRASRRVVELVALSILGALPAMFLAGFFPFDRHGLAVYWAFLVGLGVAIGLAALLTAPRHGTRPLVVCLSIIVGVLAIDVITGAHLQMNTEFGYTPTVGGRFAGIGNIAYAQLSAAALLLAALIAYRIAGRRGAWLATALLGLALVVDGLPIWGADVGGVLSMAPAYAIVVAGLLGLRIRVRTVVIAGAATVVALTAATLVDLARPKAHQSHLGRLVSSTREGGWHSFAVVIQRKLSFNIDALWPSQWTVMSPIVLAFLVYIVWQSPGALRGLFERIPTLRSALLGFVVLAVLGFGLNDSGIPIPGVMIGILAPVLIVILIREPVPTDIRVAELDTGKDRHRA